MRPHSPAFEQALHAAARAKLRQSPEQWRAYRRTYWTHPPAWVPTTAWLAVAALLLYFKIIKPLLVDSPSETVPVSVECRLLIDLILTWALLLVRFFWGSLQQALLAPVQRLPLSQHRLLGRCVFEFGKQMVLLAGGLGLLGALVAVYYEGRFLWQAGLVFGGLQAINVFALALAWAAWAPNRPARVSRFSALTKGLMLNGVVVGTFGLT